MSESSRTRVDSWTSVLRAHGLALAAWLAAAAYLFATRTQPMRLNWGDPWSDSNVQLAGRHFAEDGFVANAFTPILDVGPVTAESLRYTHYPPLPDLVNGIQHRLFGPLDISTYRILADALSLASVIFFFRWARALWGAAVANVAVALLVTNLLWLQYADTIHHIPLYWFFGFATLDLTASWLATGRRSLLWLAMLAVFSCMIASYDYFFFVPVLVAATIWVKGARLRSGRGRAIAAAVAAGVVLAVLVKFALVAWAVGPRTFASDLLFQLQERTTSKHSTEYRAGLVPIFFGRCTRFFTPFAYPVFAFDVFVLVRSVWRRKPLATPLIALAGGVPFLIVFSQLFVEQYHPTLQLLPYYAIGLGAAIAGLWACGTRGARAAAAASLICVVGWQGWQLTTFEKTFLERGDVSAVRAYLDAHDHRRVMFSNGMIDGPSRTYFDRHALHIGKAGMYDGPRILEQFFDENGDEPVHFVEFTNVVKTAFDKLLYAFFALDGRWNWIANPAAHRAEWEPLIRARDATTVSVFSSVGTLVLDTGSMRVWRIDAEPLRAFRVEALGDAATSHVDFGDPASNVYKAVGVRYSEKPGDQPGYAWTTRRQRSHYRFTMQGMVQVPDAPPTDSAVLRLRAPAREARISMQLCAALPDQHVDVVLGGHPIGRWDVGVGWSTYSVVARADDFDPSGLQRLELRVSRVNELGLGVAIRTLDLSEP